MRSWAVMLLMMLSAFAGSGRCQGAPPLEPAGEFKLPADIGGGFDHFGVDVNGRRLFLAAEGYKAVLVLDLDSGKLLHVIHGLERPHAILYRQDLHRLYITDGGAGGVKIFDSRNYRLLQFVKLRVDSDSICYDRASGDLYVDNGGKEAHQIFSFVSIVDTGRDRKAGDIKIDGDTLEAMRLQRSGPLLFVNNPAKNQVEVINRQSRKIMSAWPVTKGRRNVAMAFDEAHHRLFLGCRSGQIVVMNTETGKEVRALPIGQGVDDLSFDPASQRVYASCHDAVYVYRETSPDQYASLGNVSSGPGGRTSRLVPQLHRFFVAVPRHGSTPAEVLVYDAE
ncbi:MAG: hypothetical protein ACRD1N_11145 [Terriglobia bacterium]